MILRLKGILLVATTVLVGLTALPAAATTTMYICHNHPDGRILPPSYGLRLDYLLGNGRWTFSFDYVDGTGAAVVMITADDVAGTIHITGRAYGGQDIGGSWSPSSRGWINIDFNYSTNVEFQDDCAGAVGNDFHVTTASPLNTGTIQLDGWGGNQTFTFTDRASEAGCSFNFDNDWDSKGNQAVANDPSIWSAAGWLQPADINGSRDWVFVAEVATVPTEQCTWGHIKSMYRE